MLKLRAKDFDVMKEHAEREFPHECCGVIIGDFSDNTKTEVRPCANIQNELNEKYPDKYTRSANTGYFIDPKDLHKAMMDASKQNLDIIGFYHSHPNHEPYWSAEDNRAAMWEGTGEPLYPDASHVVISVYDGKVKGASVFKWNDPEKKFLQHDVEL
ncbi:hypothetical protein MNBD_NITROSPINAE01-1777 [hydrothermal vent metagenome]|uniref:MPN domain-containing protein n=1 Tax=hydrothermal vent metagenome TaxID=652676 RepID=A0A3B1CTV0_9ZZZZ